MNKNRWLLLQGQFISNAGTQVALVASVYWLKQRVNSATIVGLLMAATSLPTVLLGMVGGVLADRWPRIRIIVVCDALAGLLVLLVGFLTWSKPALLISVAVTIFLANCCLAVINAFFLPAVYAMIGDLFAGRAAQTTISMFQAVGLVSTVAGQALGGILLSTMTPSILFLIDGVTYFYAAATESRIDTKTPTNTEPAPVQAVNRFSDGLRLGLQTVWASKELRALFFTALTLNMAMAPLFVLLPFYAVEVIHQPGNSYGYLLAAYSSGSLLGFAGASLARPLARSSWRILSSYLFATALVPIALSSSAELWLSMSLLLLLGVLMALITMIALNRLQAVVPERIRGRIMGLLITLCQGMMPMAMAVTGILADRYPGQTSGFYRACGLTAILITIHAVFSFPLRAFFDRPDYSLTPVGKVD